MDFLIFGEVFAGLGAFGVLICEGYRGLLHPFKPDLGVKIRHVFKVNLGREPDDDWEVPLRWMKRRYPEPGTIVFAHVMMLIGIASLLVWCLSEAGSAVVKWL